MKHKKIVFFNAIITNNFPFKPNYFLERPYASELPKFPSQNKKGSWKKFLMSL